MICNKCHGQTFELNGVEVCPECERWKVRFEYERVVNERERNRKVCGHSTTNCNCSSSSSSDILHSKSN